MAEPAAALFELLAAGLVTFAAGIMGSFDLMINITLIGVGLVFFIIAFVMFISFADSQYGGAA